MLTAAVVGYLAIALFKWLLKTDKMIIFIIYTAVVGLAVIVISILEMQSGVNFFTGVPIGYPNSSPRAARTAGAVCTNTVLDGAISGLLTRHCQECFRISHIIQFLIHNA